MKGTTQYETKSVRFDPEDGVTMYRIMITTVDMVGNGPLNDSGFGGKVMFFTLLESKPMRTFYDPYRLKDYMSDDSLKRFAISIKRSFVNGYETGLSWEELEDGETYTTEDI